MLYCIDRCWSSTSIVVGGSMYMHIYGEILRGDIDPGDQIKILLSSFDG